MCHVSCVIFCLYRGGEVLTKGERESRVRGGLCSNWGDDDVDDKATVWHREGYGDGQCILCAEGTSKDVSAWGVWEDVDQEKNIGPGTAREMTLRHVFETRRLGMFILFVVIWVGTSTRYSV